MLKFKILLQKEILQVVEVLVLLTSDTSFISQGLLISIYALVSIHHGKVSCLLLVNGDINLTG